MPGDYWLDASFLGVNAAYFCFHVSERPSRKAKRRMRYDWGDLAPATRQLAGKLVDSQPGTGESPIWISFTGSTCRLLARNSRCKLR